MELLRQLGHHTVFINANESCGISLEDSTLRSIQFQDSSMSLSKKQLLGAISNGDDYLPLSLYWEVLDRCNFSCPFCYIVGHSSSRIVRFSEIHSHLSDLVEEGLLFCTLTGGEAILHPDFADIYTFLKESGVFVEVFTNGYTLDDKLIDLFMRYRPYSIEVSLYSMKDDKLKRVYGASGDRPAATVRDNVLKLQKHGLPVVCKTFLNTLTRVDLAEIVRWCGDNALEHYSSSDLTPAYDGASLSHFQVDNKEGDSRLPIAPVKSYVCFPCDTKHYGCAITPSFEIFPCPSIRHRDCYFDLRQLGVRESLRRMKSFMRTFQNMEIKGGYGGQAGCKTCIAFSEPLRNESGEILFFTGV
jgi:MoaA/NifB/PqqE/SkfB family radical SAM enzyme